MIKKNKIPLILSSIVILLPVFAGLLLWNRLPQRMPTHWGADAAADGFGGKAFTVFGIPVILLALHWLLICITAKDPKNQDQSRKVFHIVLWVVPVVSLLICGTMYFLALGNEGSMDLAVRALFGILFVALGNYLPKCKPNHTIGVRVTWTLRNEENWNRTHRFTGRLWVFGGVLVLATLFVPLEKFMYSVLVFALVLGCLPILYSYLYYRRQLKKGTATKEEMVSTPEEKKWNTGVWIFAIVILIPVIFLFTTGKIEITYQDTSFTIHANVWADATISYADIDSMEYRKQDEPGSRTFGYGSFSLMMGEFTNSEFGNYTRYSHCKCDACVVLTIGDKVLVLNGEDEESTEQIYRELTERVQNCKP